MVTEVDLPWAPLARAQGQKLKKIKMEVAGMEGRKAVCNFQIWKLDFHIFTYYVFSLS